MSGPAAVPRCEGYRRYGGAFTLGPVRWQQCRKQAIVRITVVQEEGEGTFPACMTCWNEAKARNVEIKNVEPIAVPGAK